MSDEWKVPEVDIPVRQGDILICRHLQTNKISEICLVITADCDISKGKFGRQIGCLRIKMLNDYLRSVWAEKKLKKIRQAQISTVRDQIAKWHSLQLGSKSAITDDAVEKWVLRADADTICAQLVVPDDKKKGVAKSINLLTNALRQLDDTKLSDPMHQLATFKTCISEKSLDVCRQEILKEAGQKDTLPEDVFLLTSLPQLQVGPSVVMLRELVGVAYEEICYRATDASTEDKFLRVGRLEPTFKYAVSQAFGSLYSRIGLPAEYEKRRDIAIQEIQSFKWD